MMLGRMIELIMIGEGVVMTVDPLKDLMTDEAEEEVVLRGGKNLNIYFRQLVGHNYLDYLHDPNQVLRCLILD